MKLQLKVNDDGIIEDAKFKTFGCGSAIASSSLITTWVKGKTLDEAATIKNSDIAEYIIDKVQFHNTRIQQTCVAGDKLLYEYIFIFEFVVVLSLRNNKLSFCFPSNLIEAKYNV